MDKKGRRWALWLAPLLFCGVLLLAYRSTQFVEKAREVRLDSGDLDPNTLEGRTVRLLCRTDQMTEVWFVAEAAATQADVFTPLETGLPLIVSGQDPFDVLTEELTLYGDNRFILEGRLRSTDRADGVWLFEIEHWEIVYPVKSAFRPFFFDWALYPFDFKG